MRSHDASTLQPASPLPCASEDPRLTATQRAALLRGATRPLDAGAVAVATLQSLVRAGYLGRLLGSSRYATTDAGLQALAGSPPDAEADGHCTRCGLRQEDPRDVTHVCPRGFLPMPAATPAGARPC